MYLYGSVCFKLVKTKHSIIYNNSCHNSNQAYRIIVLVCNCLTNGGAGIAAVNYAHTV